MVPQYGVQSGEDCGHLLELLQENISESITFSPRQRMRILSEQRATQPSLSVALGLPTGTPAWLRARLLKSGERWRGYPPIYLN